MAATFRLSRSPASASSPDPIDIRHQALSRYVDVTAPVYEWGSGAAQSAIQASSRSVSFPLDYHAEIVGGTPGRSDLAR